MSLTCASRRQIIKGLGGVMLTGMVPAQAYASRSTRGVRELSFYNRHTGERQHAPYWIDGQHQTEALNGFDHILRDHRQDLAAPMDKGLFDLLYRLQTQLSYRNEIHIISGYRSPKTNAMLAARSNRVARKSYHMKGMAVDIALPGVPLAQVRDAALSLKSGGVGYYPKSGFVHLDTGRVRHW